MEDHQSEAEAFGKVHEVRLAEDNGG